MQKRLESRDNIISILSELLQELHIDIQLQKEHVLKEGYCLDCNEDKENCRCDDMLSSSSKEEEADKISENGEVSCSYCCEDITDLSSILPCNTCDNFVCVNCTKKYHDFDWYSVPAVCDECKNVMCRDCANFCHDCMNSDMAAETKVYCDNCSPEFGTLTRLDCEYHDWYTCGKHDEDEQYSYRDKGMCGECYANRNYDMKHRI